MTNEKWLQTVTAWARQQLAQIADPTDPTRAFEPAAPAPKPAADPTAKPALPAQAMKQKPQQIGLRVS